MDRPAVMRNTFNVESMLNQSLDYLSCNTMGNYQLFSHVSATLTSYPKVKESPYAEIRMVFGGGVLSYSRFTDARNLRSPSVR